MKKLFRHYKSSFILAASLTLLLAGCGGEQASTTAEEPVKETPVKVALIKKGDLQTENEIVGQVKADSQVEVYSKVAGELLTFNVNKGDWVEKGQVIGKVDDQDLVRQLQLQQVGLQQAQTQLETAQINKRKASNGLENAKLTLEQAELTVEKEKPSDETQPEQEEPSDKTQPEKKDEQQEKSYTQSEIDLETLSIQLEDAKRNLERMKELYNEGAIAQKDYEQAVIAEQNARLNYEKGKIGQENSMSSYDQASIAVENAKETVSEAEVGAKQANIAVEQAQVQLSQAKDRVNDAVIRATQSGEIVAIGAKVGDTVTSQAPVVTIVSLDPIVIQATISADQLPLFKKGEQVRIELPSLNEEVNGKITYVASVANDAGLYEVETAIENPDSVIKPGMVAKFIVDEVRVKDTLLVPTDAVIEDGAANIVYIVEEGKAVAKEVEVVEAQTDWTAIRGDLNEKEQIVVKGQNTLSDGNLVKVIKEG
ncbi:efflux RND transporter periplasmic adaptor subunit [Bacillus solimangrovi]|uniref:Uncharacterized protein n=1 Tax=Bacillus solimangrovi TaxID=1305675 RepID=A0A1E5LDK8_9BACI|nr:efflux RND transporter periplasmic adaptor subunit [Bacillus solimangrovi]OEH92173.1 hypothetical protein BFG57_02570 [Bacillus solimangrovi]